MPSVMILFVMSHGDSKGVIWTDTKSDTQPESFETFTTAEVLAKLSKWEQCLKMIFFCPCRGALMDNDEESSQRTAVSVTTTSCLQNTIIAYSSVEYTKALRNVTRGSSFVECVCDAFNNLSVDTPVENVLVSMQNAMHRCGVTQTPEIVYSVKRKLIVHKWISSSSSSDATANTKNMISKEREMFFNWCSDECEQIRGRWAAVFGDGKQSEVGNVVHALRDGLSFDTTVVPNSFESLDSVGNKTRGEANNVGCFLACFFAKLSLNDEQNAICVEIGSSGHYTVGEIVGKLTGPDNSKWIGRPKIFIFLHQHNTLDCAAQATKFEIQATRSSGTLVCILNGKDAANDFTDCICDQRLKNGSNLQEMMLGLIGKYGNNGECQFSSQLTSTMHFLLDFPDWPVIFIEPSLSVSTTHEGSYEDVSFDALQKDYLIQLCDKKSKMKICFVSAKIGAGKSTLLREIAEYLKKEAKNVYTVDLSRQRANFQSDNLLKLQYLLKMSGDICYDDPKSVILFDGVDVMVKEFPNQMDHLFSQMLENDASIVIATSPLYEDLFMQKFGMLAMMWVKIKPFDKTQQLSLLMKASARSALECNLLLNKLDAYSGLLQSPEFIMFISDSFDTTSSNLVEKFIHKKLECSVITKGGFDQKGENFKSIVDEYEKVLQNCAQQFLEVTSNKYMCDSLHINVLNSTGIVTVQEDGKTEFQYKEGAKFIAAQRFLMDVSQNKSEDTQVHKLTTILMFVDKILADYNADQKELLIENFKTYTSVNYIFQSAVSDGLENIFELLQNLFTFSVHQPHKTLLSGGFLFLELAHDKSKSISNSLFKMGAHITLTSRKEPVEKRKKLAFSEDVHELATIKDSITSVSNEKKSVLHFAVERNNRSFMNFLIHKGIQTEDTDAMNWTCLHVAVEKADLNTIKDILSFDVGLIKRKTKTGLTCFLIAAYYAKVETCEFLIKNGVDWNAKDNFGNNALHYAAMAGNDAIIHLLVNDLEFDVNGTSNDGLTALHFAASGGHLEVISSLLSLGADRMAMTLMGWNTLHFAVRFSGVETVKIVTQDLVTNDLINLLFTRTTDGCSLFHFAACNRDGFEILNFLLTQNVAFLSVVNNINWNLLHFACKYNNFAIVKWLMIKHKNFVNMSTTNSSTALILAAKFASFDICKLLVENGATICNVDVFGNSAITYAFTASRFDVFKFLVSKASFFDILKITASRQQMSVAKYFLQTDSRVNEVNEKNETALFFTVRNEINYATEMLIQNGADVNHKNTEGWTPLMLTAENAQYCIFDLLIANGAIIHCRNNNGESVLHMACKNGNLVATTRLLNSKLPLDVNSEDNKRRTALYVATQHKHKQIVQLLLANGADVNRSDHTMMTPSLVAAGNSFEIYMILEQQKSLNLTAVNCDGKNALHLASERGNEKVVSHLLNKKNPSISDKDTCCGWTALHYAAANGKVEIAKLLIASGANVDDKDFNSSTPLSMAAKFSSKEMLKFLVASGATLDVQDETGDNALHCAVTGGKYNNVLYLVEEKSFTTKQKGRDGRTALHFSVIANNLVITKLLLDKKDTDINAKDKNNDTPLLLAAKYANVETIKYLLWKNAELKAKNKSGDSALHCAVLGEKMLIIEYLVKTQKFGLDLKNKKKRTLLHYAALVGNLQIAEFLATDKKLFKVTINAQDEDGLTPLIIAKKVEMMKFLVDNGAILDALDKDGKTALHISSLSGKIDVVKYLIGIKPDLIQQSSLEGVTALHEASSRGFVEVAELLIKGSPRGAVVDARNHSQQTPLMFAASVEMCDLLVQNKSYPYCDDCNGDTALHFACRNGKLDIVKYLVKHDYHLLNKYNKLKQPPESNARCKINKEVQNYILNVRKAHHETPCDNAACVVR